MKEKLLYQSIFLCDCVSARRGKKLLSRVVQFSYSSPSLRCGTNNISLWLASELSEYEMKIYKNYEIYIFFSDRTCAYPFYISHILFLSMFFSHRVLDVFVVESTYMAFVLGRKKRKSYEWRYHKYFRECFQAVISLTHWEINIFLLYICAIIHVSWAHKKILNVRI